MMHSAEVLEFVVVPPFHKRDQVAAAEARFADFLGRRFRGYTFRIAGFAPVGSSDDDDFYVLPVMNFVNADGNMQMCDKPRAWLIDEIASACKDFDLVTGKSYAL